MTTEDQNVRFAPGEFNESTQHLLILADEEVCEWRGMHGHGSRRNRRLSCGSAGRAVNVWRTSRERLRGGTRAASIGSWLAMEGLLQRHAGGLWERCGLRSAKRFRGALPPVGRYGGSHRASNDRPQLSAERSDVTAAAAPTAPARLISAPCRATMARRAEARAPVVAGADLWLAEAAIPCRPGHASISRNDLSESLFIQTRGVLKKALMAQLRTTRQMRQAKGGTTKSGLGQIVDAASIRERPAEADDRAVPGHWEGDLLSGANNTHIATLVERHTRFVMLLKVPSKDTATVVAALGKHVRKLPQELRRSLTWDRGKEMADHKSFTVATNVQVYFCDPRSPWQRGSNENTNGLLRQYFPRGTDLSRFSQAYLNRIALRLNQRPRKTLGFETPADRLRAVLQ